MNGGRCQFALVRGAATSRVGITIKRGAFPLALLITMTASAVAQQQTPAPPRFATTKVTPDQIESYRSEVEAIPGVHCHDIWAQQRECSSSSRLTVWTFTLSGHPAHPAVSRAIMLVQQTAPGSLMGIDRSGHYAGDDAAFEAWSKQLRVLDQKEVARWQSILRPR